jgi:hypothetical protein
MMEYKGSYFKVSEKEKALLRYTSSSSVFASEGGGGE